MKREFSEDLGLEKEDIHKIMAENGKDINNEKAKLTTKENEKALQALKFDILQCKEPSNY